MSYPTLPEIRQELSKNVMQIGMIVNARKPPTYDELTALRDSLNTSAESVQTIRDMIVFE